MADPKYTSPDAAKAAADAKAAAAKAAADKKAAATASANKNLEALFGDNGTIKVAFDQYGNLILQKIILDKNGKPTGEFSQVYFNPSTTAGDKLILTASEVVARVKSAYKSNLEALRKSLYDRNYISKKEYTTKSESAFNAAILKSANEHSVEQVQKYTINKKTDFSTYSTWLSKKPGYSTSGDSTPDIDTQKVATPKSETDQDIDAFFFDMLGRAATPDEKTKYYNAVKSAESNASRKATVSGTTSTTVNTLLTDEDYSRIKASILKPAVLGVPIETLTKGTGKISQGINSLTEYAAAYGIIRTPKDLIDDILEGMVVGGALTTGDLDQQKTKIRAISKARYSNLANLIDEGVKISDIANQFAYYKGRLLEMPDNAVSVFDEDIQAALANKDANGKTQNGVMSIVDYEKLLRTDAKTKPLWLKTSQAREEASGYATDILRTFGLMG